MGFRPEVAGRGGRTPNLGSRPDLAAAVWGKGAPGTTFMGFNPALAGRGGRK
jgi:hypothetical protein